MEPFYSLPWRILGNQRWASHRSKYIYNEPQELGEENFILTKPWICSHGPWPSWIKVVVISDRSCFLGLIVKRIHRSLYVLLQDVVVFLSSRGQLSEVRFCYWRLLDFCLVEWDCWAQWQSWFNTWTVLGKELLSSPWGVERACGSSGRFLAFYTSSGSCILQGAEQRGAHQGRCCPNREWLEHHSQQGVSGNIDSRLLSGAGYILSTRLENKVSFVLSQTGSLPSCVLTSRIQLGYVLSVGLLSLGCELSLALFLAGLPIFSHS